MIRAGSKYQNDGCAMRCGDEKLTVAVDDAKPQVYNSSENRNSYSACLCMEDYHIIRRLV